MRTDIYDRIDDIITWIGERVPKSEIARRLNCGIGTLNVYLDKLGIVYHGNQGGEHYKTFKMGSYIPYEIYIKEGVVQSNKLRKKLIREGLKQEVCESCGNYEWMGKPIPLEVHHVDGDKSNNQLSNLQILCPNCHALTSTYRGKNIGKT